MTVLDQVFGVIALQFERDVSSVRSSASLEDDYEADSLDRVELLLRLEDAFSSADANRRIEIPMRSAYRWRTVGDVVDYMHSVGFDDTMI